ncbi:MAG TPA: hypothetical protein VFB19_16335 [Mycobacterium sp.]|nr:hypothetical protein [Mycobacterium sp.]
MTTVRRATTRIGMTLVASAALVAATHATAAADPGTHQVTYTVTTAQEASINLNYLVADPPSKAALNANSSDYLRRDQVDIAPGAPWVFQTTLTDTSWAYVMAGGAARYNGSPNPHCEIAVDGKVVTQADGETGAQCALKAW